MYLCRYIHLCIQYVVSSIYSCLQDGGEGRYDMYEPPPHVSMNEPWNGCYYIVVVAPGAPPDRQTDDKN